MDFTNLEKIIAKVELVLQNQSQLEQQNLQQQLQIQQLSKERDQLRLRLQAAGNRVEQLLQHFPAQTQPLLDIGAEHE